MKTTRKQNLLAAALAGVPALLSAPDWLVPILIQTMRENYLVMALRTGLLALVHLVFIARAILRAHREPASRVAWVVVMVVLPMVGIVAYILLGETNIGRRRAARLREVLARLPDPAEAPGAQSAELQPAIPDRYDPLFRVGHSVNGFEPVGGNRTRLMADSNAAIESMITDIDAARDHVHLTFYIWLPDNNGLKMVEALKRAAARKVICRAMADGLGSRILLASEHWKAMRDAGVHENHTKQNLFRRRSRWRAGFHHREQ